MHAVLDKAVNDIPISDIMRASAARFISLCDIDFIGEESKTKTITIDNISPAPTITTTPLPPKSNSTDTFVQAAEGNQYGTMGVSTDRSIPMFEVNYNEH